MTAPQVSVVIPVRDARPYLAELCEALSRQEPVDGGYEIVMVDDRSRDGGYEYLLELTERDSRFQVLRGPGRGPGSARNRGVAAARGRLIAFTDADTLPEPDWLRAAVTALNHQKVRALEGAVLPWSPTQPGYVVRTVRNQTGGKFMTANMLYERALLLEVGGFDEAFRRPFLEDSDLAFRVLSMGIPIPFVSQVRVRHRDVAVGAVQLLREQVKLQWVPLLAKKHPARYRRQLRPQIQTLRPGDADLLLALPLVIAARRSSIAVRGLAWLAFGLALRRVIGVAEAEKVSPRQRPVWLLVSLIAPALRAAHLLAGWVRFRKVAI